MGCRELNSSRMQQGKHAAHCTTAPTPHNLWLEWQPYAGTKSNVPYSSNDGKLSFELAMAEGSRLLEALDCTLHPLVQLNSPLCLSLLYVYKIGNTGAFPVPIELRPVFSKLILVLHLSQSVVILRLSL